MKVVLYEPETGARAVLCRRLREFGCGVAPFTEARIAFLFLLGRLHEIDGVLVSVRDGGEGAWLLERLELLREPLVVVTYRDAEGSALELRGLGNVSDEQAVPESLKMEA